MTAPSPQASLAIRMRSFRSETMATAVSKLVADFCQVVLGDADLAWRFRLAAHELAENVVKYAAGPRLDLTVELEEVDASRVLRIRSCNDAKPEQLREVEARLRELVRADDPVALYDRLIRETASRSDVSGLGLARIRAEGELDISYTIQGSALTIAVHASVGAGEGRSA